MSLVGISLVAYCPEFGGLQIQLATAGSTNVAITSLVLAFLFCFFSLNINIYNIAYSAEDCLVVVRRNDSRNSPV